MTIIALTEKGTEYTYYCRTAHKVAKRTAEKVASLLNENGYKMNFTNSAPEKIWKVYDITEYEFAADYASMQRFMYCKNGSVKRIVE